MNRLRKARWMTILLVAGVLLLGAIPAWGMTHNVVPGQSIQAAIDAASPGDTVHVAAGVYQEELASWKDMEITKSLNLIGDGSGVTIVQLRERSGGTGPMNGVEIRGNNLEVLIEGITFTRRPGSTYASGFPLRIAETTSTFKSLILRNVEVAYANGPNVNLGSSGTYEQVVIENCEFHHGGTWGLYVQGGVEQMTVEDSDFEYNGQVDPGHGVGFDLSSSSGCEDVTVTGGSFSHNTSKGINLVNSTNVVFQEVIADENGEFGVCLWEWSGGSSDLRFADSSFSNNGVDGFLFGTEGTCTIDGVQIENCYLNDNGRYGVLFYHDFGGTASNIQISENDITGNLGGPLAISAGGQVDASANWWGTTDSTVVAGLVDPTKVDFSPILNSGADGDPAPGWQPDLSSVTVHTLGQQVGTTGRIQEGVDLITSSTVNVAAGIYYESVDIDDSMNLLGENGAILDGTGGSSNCGINIDAGGVIVDNLDVRDYPDGVLAYAGADNATDWTDIVITNNIIHETTGAGNPHGFGLYVGTEGERFMLPTPPWGMSPLTQFLDLTGLRIEGNEIYNTHHSAIVLQSIMASSGTLDVLGNDLHDAGSSAIWIDSARDIKIEGNDLRDSAAGVEISSYSDGWYEGTPNTLFDSRDIQILYNIITGNSSSWGAGVVVYDGWPATMDVNFNVITGNGAYGVWNWVGGGDIDASLNWWGNANGPSGEGSGTGDSVSANVIFSPWLGIYPDGDAGTVGVQVRGPMLIIVAPVGPEPTTVNGNTGYLNQGIWGSNELPGTDTIEVRDGTYDASEPITDGVNIFSAVGTEGTILNGAMSLDVANIIIGIFGQGFTINGAITVGAGIDASTIHINWNDIYGIVTNAGLKVLDATFNYWDTDGPDTVGRVNVYPYLPIPAADIIGYMDDYGFNAMQAITFARLLLKGLPAGWAEVAIEVEATFGISINDAMALIREYGLGSVKRALRMASTPDDFLVMLVGYVAGGGGGGFYLGGGAGGSTGMSSFCVGCSIPLQIELVHPITGEVVTDAVVSYSVCRTLPDGTTEIVMLGVMTYDDGLGAYTFEVDTTGLEPGIYDIYIGTDDGRSQHFQIEIAVF